MPVKFRRKSDLDIALTPIIEELGHNPTPTELSLLLGGDPADWGRILRGQQKIAGEYHARLKLVKDAGFENARLELAAAARSKKYGERTRKGRIVPHPKNVLKDMYGFNLEKMTLEITGKKTRGYEYEYDYYSCYLSTGEDIYVNGLHIPKDISEEQTLRRDFIKSLS
jgi:hypothetical protein